MSGYSIENLLLSCVYFLNEESETICVCAGVVIGSGVVVGSGVGAGVGVGVEVGVGACVCDFRTTLKVTVPM